MREPLERIVNVGTGEDLMIGELAEMVAEIVGFRGRIVRDESKPDGTMRKLMDSGRLYATGWRPGIALRDGIASAYRDFLDTTTVKRGLSPRQPGG